MYLMMLYIYIHKKVKIYQIEGLIRLVFFSIMAVFSPSVYWGEIYEDFNYLVETISPFLLILISFLLKFYRVWGVWGADYAIFLLDIPDNLLLFCLVEHSWTSSQWMCTYYLLMLTLWKQLYQTCCSCRLVKAHYSRIFATKYECYFHI